MEKKDQWPIKGESIELKIIEDGIEKALDYVANLKSRRKTYIDSATDYIQSHESLAFHNLGHTESVIDRFEKIIAFLKKEGVNVGSEKDIQVGKLGAAFHDTVQDYKEVEKIEPEMLNGQKNLFSGLKKKVRERAVGANEKVSADLAIAYMHKVNREKPGTFTAQDENLIKNQIEMTVPSFDPSANTVIQPNLDKNSKSSTVERALALADLASAGMDTPDKFIAEGNAIFREENLDIMDAIYKLKDGKEIPEKEKEYFKNRMLSWSKFQPIFASGRKKIFDKEVSIFPESVQKNLKEKLFNMFESSIQATAEKAKLREQMTFEEIAKDMGYEI